MLNIEARLAALEELARRRRELEEDTPDGLSRSLSDWITELGELDDLGRAAMLAEMNCGDDLDGSMGLDLSKETLDAMIADFTQGSQRKII